MGNIKKEDFNNETTIKEKGKYKKYNYFEALERIAEYTTKASTMLNNIFLNFNSETLQELNTEMHKIEHDADIIEHEITNRLIKEFIPPIEREDILRIAQEVDDVVDCIEDVSLRLYMYNVKSLRPEAIAFSEIIVESCEALCKAIKEFYNFKKSKTIKDMLIYVNKLEEDGDKLYIEAMHNLYSSDCCEVEIVAWTNTFDYLEKCCDACEHTAEVMSSVIIKNT